MSATTTVPAVITTWTIDPVHSSAEFRVKHMMIANVRGRFTGVTGKLTYNTSDVTKSGIEASVDVATLSLRSRIAGGLWSLLPSGIALLALRRLWQLFGEYAAGRVFGSRALASLRGFARCTLAMGLAAPLYGAVLSVIMTWDRAPGTRQLNVQFDSGNYAAILLGAVMLAIASVMAEAARVAEDNAGFV